MSKRLITGNHGDKQTRVLLEVFGIQCINQLAVSEEKIEWICTEGKLAIAQMVIVP